MRSLIGFPVSLDLEYDASLDVLECPVGLFFQFNAGFKPIFPSADSPTAWLVGGFVQDYDIRYIHAVRNSAWRYNEEFAAVLSFRLTHKKGLP